VVQDVDEIKVTLHDKREFEGRIIGSDPKSDLAIVKVDAEGLPAIKMGVSDGLKVGEVVIAIGNPFGLGNTITMGIISAVGRSNVGIADYEDFIQTDAAINPGNSGGALVNIRGELIGVNTAIFSTSGGYMGIGFAIPSDMAGSIMESIIKHGKVVRGWLGVTIQSVSPDLAKHFDIKEKQGALITEVMKDSPAERAGFKRGDVIVEFDGKLTEDPTGLRNMVAATLPDKTVPVKVIREGKEEMLTVLIGEMPGRMTELRSSYENVLSGVHVQDLTPEIEDRFSIPEKTTGVIVTNIDEDSKAGEMLRRGDVIQEINRRTIKESGDYEDVASKISGEENVLLLVYRSGGYIYVTINAEK
jgi:serine protease Do